jgi:hypothetical protein
MGVPIGSLYIRKYFDDSRVNTVNKGYDFFSLLLGQFSLNKC